MTENQEIQLEKNSDRLTNTASDLFWLGFVIYSASYTISTTEQVNYVVCNLFQVFGLFLLLPSSILLISFKINNAYLKILFFIYIFWLVLTVLRGVEFDYLTIKQLLFDPNTGLFLYLSPVILLIPVNINFLKKTFYAIFVLCIIYLIYNLIFIKELLYPRENMRSQAIFEYFTQQLSLSAGFLMITYVYHSRKFNLFVFFTMAVTFILAVIRARRGLIIMTFSIFFFTYLIYQYYNKTKVVNIILSVFLITFLTFISIRIYNENRKDTFSLITERISQRTRSEVEQYFYRDMQTKDWIIGKGLNGEYFCPGVTEGIGKISIYRKVVETGYLQVILNGGIISLFLLLLITVPAMIMGIFYSKNILSKAAGIWILLFFVYMYPGTVTKFSMHYLLVWISVSICYSEQIRNLSDDYIKSMLNSNQRRPDQEQT